MGRWVRQNEKNKILRTENQPMSEPKKSRFWRDFPFLFKMLMVANAKPCSLFAVRRSQIPDTIEKSNFNCVLRYSLFATRCSQIINTMRKSLHNNNPHSQMIIDFSPKGFAPEL
jgi:hypothetical protein